MVSYRAPIHDLLENVAIDKIIAGDYRYWEAMGKKHGFIFDRYDPPEKPETYYEPNVDGLSNDQYPGNTS